MNKTRVLNIVLPAALPTAVMAAFAVASMAASAALSQELDLKFGGAGWMQIGRIEESKVIDPTNDYNENWMQNSGGQIGLTARFDEKWDAGFGVGVAVVHLARGSRLEAYRWYPFWVPYVSEMRLTRTSEGLSEGAAFKVSLGNFGYGYNPDVKNLGQYLMRGYVYPGSIVSGFGNVFGALARYEAGRFSNDLILKSENEDRPLYDWSLANVVTWRALDGLELGAGVNFYRVIAGNGKFRDPGTSCPIANGEQCYILGDTVGVDSTTFPGFSIPIYDTITGDLSGTKLMARFSLDPKRLLGFSSLGGREFGKSDLVLYGEAAVLGLTDYPKYYEDIKRRIPVMLGLNLPMMGLLDYLSVEVEYYASKNFTDINYTGETASWIPPTTTGPATQADTKRDDWKWSVNTAKVIFGSLQLSGQVASDHLRPGGSNHSPNGIEAFGTPKDWYWTAKLAYFF